MEKLKDFFYDKNDLVVALIIITIAGLLIVWRVNVIMNYPKIMAAEIVTQQEELGNEPGGSSGAENQPAGDGSSDGSAGQSGDADQNNGTDPSGNDDPNSSEPNNPGSSANQGGTPAGNSGAAAPAVTSRSITIPPGSSGTKIAQILVDAGLISSAASFNEAVTAAGADTKLKAGTFTIPAGASAAEIVNIITR